MSLWGTCQDIRHKLGIAGTAVAGEEGNSAFAEEHAAQRKRKRDGQTRIS